MKKNIFSNRSKTEYKRMMARYLIVMLLGLPIVANLNEYAFADDIVTFDPGVEYAEDVQDADIMETKYEDINEADNEMLELAGLEDITDDEVIECSESTEAGNPDVEEPALGRLYEDVYMPTEFYNHWNAYAKLKFGDKVKAVAGVKPVIGVSDIDLLGGYDKENNCWYGVARIPEYETYDRNKDGFDNIWGSAIVRIDGVDKVELDKEYDATYLYDCNLYFNSYPHDEPFTVQYKDGRIYTTALWTCYRIYDSSFTKKIECGYDMYLNSCYMCLLYSTDISGNDIKLHYRYADLNFDMTKKTPWYANLRYLDNKQTQIIDGNERYWKYKGFAWHDGKWQGAFVCYAWDDKDEKRIHLDTAYEPLPNGIISDDDIGGFLSPSDYWFDKRNATEEPELFSLGPKYYGARDGGDCARYLLHWLYDNGYKKHLYIDSLPYSKTDARIYEYVWGPEILDKYGKGDYDIEKYPWYEEGHNYTDNDIAYVYTDGTIKKGGEVVKPGKKDDPSGDITEDDIPAPKTIEYNLGPVVVKNQLDIKQLVSSNSAVKMKYKVDNKKIAKVNSKGIMTGKNAGYVTVTGYAKVRSSSNKKKWVWKETGSVKVEITRPSFKGLDGGILTIKFKGDALNLNDYITNESTMTPTFSVNRSGMAKVNNDGTIEATGEGKAKVTVMFGKYKMKLKVLVTP